jgi:hypothetical protein
MTAEPDMTDADELRALVRQVIHDVLGREAHAGPGSAVPASASTASPVPALAGAADGVNGTQGGPRGLPVIETVNLSTDDDLAAFVARLLELDADGRAELLAGRKRFRLAATVIPLAPLATLPASASSTSATLGAAGVYGIYGVQSRSVANGSRTPPVRRVERGAVTEAVVRDAARAGERLVLGRGAVITPLARDRARASGVEIVKER